MGPHLQVPHPGRAPGEEKARGAVGSLQGGFASGRPDTSRLLSVFHLVQASYCICSDF